MASSHNLIQPWTFRSGDSWYPDAFARETESALTKALQQSFFDFDQSNSPFMMKNQTDYCAASVSVSIVTGSGSGSDPETPTPGSKTKLGIGKATKRKSRASKRSMTTFIQADPANFRRMVQEVTGVKLEGKLPVVRPEPIRQPFVVNKLQGLLPTLDTSACLLDLPNSNTHRSLGSPGFTAANTGAAAGGIDFASFSSFPTLESSI